MNRTALRSFLADLNTAGLDLVFPFPAQTYNTTCLTSTANSQGNPLPPLPTFSRKSTLSLLVANTKHLWPIFLSYYKSSPSARAATDPLDDYIDSTITTLLKTHFPSTPATTRYTHDTGDRFVHFQRLAHHIGFAHYNPTLFLSVHEQYGPWFAFRALVVLDIEFEENVWDDMLITKPTHIPPLDPVPDQLEAVKFHMDRFFAAAQGYDNRAHENHVHLIAARDASTKDSARHYRYSDDQIRYHYTKDVSVLDRK
ncbi:hypothetical protein BCR33DRAFT_719000 [Rhizoclosmatium globosum]|uniref:Cyanocobalamin reductase (cyanide-eliminating) n=1 Tax=Rhizoclosmatium globosum TaxID=329046 RepID=A0A1Y2C372_9FUNG|nr:hypothetical protein BCR33DRAFT_719000 [Rhizoclosmatium globosum]|eukprot:ORY41396.1 hypothetical protein BCR33DRAFT_719000 [Rhizoclosmatium globosum]